MPFQGFFILQTLFLSDDFYYHLYANDFQSRIISPYLDILLGYSVGLSLRNLPGTNPEFTWSPFSLPGLSVFPPAEQKRRRHPDWLIPLHAPHTMNG